MYVYQLGYVDDINFIRGYGGLAIECSLSLTCERVPTFTNEGAANVSVMKILDMAGWA